MTEENKVARDFDEAIGKSDLSLARKLVTMMLPDQGNETHKLRAYKQILDTAIKVGKLSAAMEVAPYCGYFFQREDLINCLMAAIRNGDMNESVLCKSRLNEAFSEHELCALGNSMLVKGIDVPAYLALLEGNRKNGNLVELLIAIITTKTNEWELSPEEKILIRVAEILRHG